MSKSFIVVCDEYKLLKNGNSYTKQGMLTQRTNCKLTRDWVELKNEKWGECGLWYEIDEEATEKYYEYGEIKRQARKDAESKKERLVSMASDMLENANKVVEEKISEIEALQIEYKEKFDKNVPMRYKNNVEWISNKLK